MFDRVLGVCLLDNLRLGKRMRLQRREQSFRRRSLDLEEE